VISDHHCVTLPMLCCTNLS